MTYIYLHGFASSPLSTKARYFRDRFCELGIELEIPDLAPDFENMTISGQMEIVRRLADGKPATLIGSSMGGYVASLYAAEDSRVEKLVVMAPAYGLADRWAAALGGEGVEKWRRTGQLSVYHYGRGCERNLSFRFVTDALQYPGFPEVSQPVLVLHGQNDTVVPVEHSVEFVKMGENRELKIFDSGHELTDVLDGLWKESLRFLEFSLRSQSRNS